MRICIIKKPSIKDCRDLEGFNVSHFEVGQVVETSARFAELMIVCGFAIPEMRAVARDEREGSTEMATRSSTAPMTRAMRRTSTDVLPRERANLRGQARSQTLKLTPPDDWRRLLRKRANAWVTGPQGALNLFVRAAQSELPQPIAFVEGTNPVLIDSARTLIVNAIHALDAAGQRELLAWMNERRGGEGQVLSLTSVPASVVLKNGFDASLYYRLNLIHLNVHAQ